MPLHLIHGPPNSGRAGAVLDAFEAALGHDPFLVVPGSEDVHRFERELCARRSMLLGGTIGRFARLFEEVAQAAGIEMRPRLTDPQRLRIVHEALARTPLETLAGSGARPGLTTALETLIGELQAAGVEPEAMAAGAEGTGYLIELARIFAAYVTLRDASGHGDSHSLAAEASAALRGHPDSWGARPVFVYGFDDLTGEELVLLRALATAAEVSVAIAYEDRAALAARATLLGDLGEFIPDSVDALSPNRSHTASAVLFHIERELFRDRDPDGTRPRLEPDNGLVLLRAAGRRAEAELVGGEISALLASGVVAEQIAVVLRDPASVATLFTSVLDGFNIPVAVEATIPFAGTATGNGLLALMRALFAGGDAADVLTFLRAPGRTSHGNADAKERKLRRERIRSATDALDAIGQRWEIDKLREAGSGAELAEAVAEVALDLAEYPHERAAPRPDAAGRLELRAAKAAANAVRDLAALEDLDLGPPQLMAALEALQVPLWRGDARGHVRIVSPYGVRAARFSHVFVASLQEGEFPRAYDPGQLLDDDERARVGLPPRRPLEQEERYLFYTCVSRPTERLYLSWRDTNEDGSPSTRSPFVDEVRDLLEPPAVSGEPDPIGERIARVRTLRDVVFPIGAAPTERELARSVATVSAAERRPALDAAGVQAELAGRIVATVSQAAAAGVPPPGPLRESTVLEQLGQLDAVGASTLESYAECSYRWFVGHELEPEELDPKPDPLAQGTVVHQTLHDLYTERPGGTPRPKPGTLDAWLARVPALLAKHAEEAGLTPRDARTYALFARMRSMVDGLLHREALSTSVLAPRPNLLEASFGRTDDERPGLELGNGVQLHGTIDRIDVPDGAEGSRMGLIRDYKTSSKVPLGKNLPAEGKLQLQLYALALRELWEIEPLGALYMPLGATTNHTPRGLLREGEADGLLEGVEMIGDDARDEKEFDTALSEAHERASTIVAGIKAGHIDRDPLKDRCPRWCTFQSICRIERSTSGDPEAEDEEEQQT